MDDFIYNEILSDIYKVTNKYRGRKLKKETLETLSGELTQTLHKYSKPEVKVKAQGNKLVIEPANEYTKRVFQKIMIN